jgi:hypothetical protein
MARSRLVVLSRRKPDGTTKERAVACGEALTRLLERAVLARWGEALHRGAAHATVHERDGALVTGAVMQGLAARGQPLISTDARRAYDVVTHAAIVEAVSSTEAPAELAGYLAASLQQREYSIGGQRIVPPAGRGTAQGTALGPAVFSLVAERAAVAVQQIAPWALAVTYIDNLFITAAEERAGQLEAALAAAHAQWNKDGMAAGETWTLNCYIEGIHQASRCARVLGVSPAGDAPERFARARAVAERAKTLGALAELTLLREVACAQVVYDVRLAASDGALEGLERSIVDQIGVRAGIRAELRGVVALPPDRRGLGVRPLLATRDAAVLAAGLTALTARRSAVWGAAWQLAARPAGAFFTKLHEVLETAGYEIDIHERTVAKGGKLVVRAPRNLAKAASIEEARRAACEIDAQRGEEAGDAGRSAVAKLLTASGPKPKLNQREYEAAVRLQCGLADPDVPGGRQGDLCLLCGDVIQRGHHRWCRGRSVDTAKQHHAVRDSVAEWLGKAASIHVHTEASVERGGGGRIRADILTNAPKDGKAVVEVKTVDLRCHTRRGLRAESTRLLAMIDRDYDGKAEPLVVSHSGAHGRETADTLAHLQAMRQHADECLDGEVQLLATIGKACAATERESFEEWAELVDAAHTAQQLAAAAAGGSRRAKAATGSRATIITPCCHGLVAQRAEGGSSSGERGRGREERGGAERTAQ